MYTADMDPEVAQWVEMLRPRPRLRSAWSLFKNPGKHLGGMKTAIENP